MFEDIIRLQYIVAMSNFLGAIHLPAGLSHAGLGLCEAVYGGERRFLLRETS